MSDDISKADTIAFHFYTKLFYTVNHARATEETRGQTKLDKWVRILIIELPCTTLTTWPRSSISRHPTRTSSRGKPGSLIEAFRSRPRLDPFPWKFRCCCPSQSSRTTRLWSTSLRTRHESGSNRLPASSCWRRGRWG